MLKFLKNAHAAGLPGIDVQKMKVCLIPILQLLLPSCIERAFLVKWSRVRCVLIYNITDCRFTFSVGSLKIMFDSKQDILAR